MTPLDFAILELGVIEDPGNTGIPFERYGLPGEEALPWCARFIRWCFAQAKTPLPGQRYLLGSVIEMQEALAVRGGIFTTLQQPKPGDIAFQRHRGDSDAGPGHHVSIIETVGPAHLGLISGNWRNAVRRVDRKRTDPELWCYGCWPVRAAA